MIGTTVSHYRILEAIGSGGMGVVYLAEDIRLHRKVALKFLHETATYGAEAQERLLREAQAEGTLDHPNIATVYEIGEWQGRTFIAMAYYPGETLKQRLERGPLALDDVVNLAAQIAAGLEAAHAAGIVHRDLKPANIIVTTNGQVKILDFGLAKEMSKAEAETKLRITTSGTTVGTIAYMAPEQALGQTVDQRADIWAFGALLFEMVTGRVPFQGATAAAVLLSIVSDTAPPVSTFRAEVPAPLQQVIASALAKQQEDRTITVDEIAATLAGLREPRGVGSPSTSASRPRARAAIVAAIGIAAIALTAGGWVLKRQADTRRLQTTGIAEIRRLAADGEFFEAFQRARASSGVASNDAELARLLGDITRPVSIVSNPSGAEVSIATYGSGAPVWIRVGETPLTDGAIPRGIVRLRLVKDRYTVSEDLLMVNPVSAIRLSVELTEERATPPGMVRVDGPERPVPSYLAPGSDPVDVIYRDFWLDRYEVSNRQFKAFVDAGGYQRREFWRHDFVRDGKPVSWEDAMASFRDATGRQGPATWQVGAYPEGQGEYPVTGVSWYVVKGTFERGTDQFTSTTAKDSTLWRDYTVAYYKDLARTLDYLATRPDTDKDRIAFFGLSRGAALSPIPLALEPQRIKAAVLLIPGFYLSRQPPEVDIINFLPRVTQPVLMLSGRYDFIFPEQRSQLSFFAMLGTPADRKRRVAYDSGHNVPQAEQIKETLDWLDRYLGPVARQ